MIPGFRLPNEKGGEVHDYMLHSSLDQPCDLDIPVELSPEDVKKLQAATRNNRTSEQGASGNRISVTV